MNKWRLKSGKDEDVILSTRIRLARNLKGFRFPNTFDREESKLVDELINISVDKLYPGEYKHFFLKEMNNYSRVLMENHLISPELIKNKDFSSYCLKDDESVNIMINEEDHLRLQVLESGLALEDAYEKAASICRDLETQVDFSYHHEFGYLTACPTNTGTGLRASVMMHLPAIKHSGMMPGLIDSLGKLGVTVRGIYGENSSAIGDLFQISNQRTLGMTEKEVVIKLKMLANRITENERKLRDGFKESHPLDFEDKVYRSLGLLKYSRLISEKEALECLSYLRVGICEGLYDGLSIKQVTDLIFNLQKYNILKYKKDMKIDGNENSARSHYIDSYFREVGIDG
ncbi:MAG: ATP--guanido phosphotransferase [Tissierellia bacterium]|nr:ATP--guanido phosphotransferase [Tissierellia bacterium]